MNCRFFTGSPTGEFKRSDSQETPPTPLFEEDQSQPLEAFPRITYSGPGWEMFLRQPNKKKITGQRYESHVKYYEHALHRLSQIFNKRFFLEKKNGKYLIFLNQIYWQFIQS